VEIAEGGFAAGLPLGLLYKEINKYTKIKTEEKR
jgi:hypothetical protein